MQVIEYSKLPFSQRLKLVEHLVASEDLLQFNEVLKNGGVIHLAIRNKDGHKGFNPINLVFKKPMFESFKRMIRRRLEPRSRDALALRRLEE